MRTLVSILFASALLSPASMAWGKPGFSVVLSETADNNSGRTLDADLSASISNRWQLGVGGGSARSQSLAGELRATNVRSYVEAYSDNLGLRGYLQRWRAASYEMSTVGARGYVTHDNFRLGVIGEAKRLNIDYLSDPSTGQYSARHFSGSGWGLAVEYRYRQWFVYVSGMGYRHNDLSEYLQEQNEGMPPSGDPGGAPPLSTPTSPDLRAPLPSNLAPPTPPGTGSPGLTSAVMALNQGVLSHQYSAGVEYDFKRSAAYLDWNRSKDAIYAQTTNYYSASYLHRLAAALHVVATVGVSNSNSGSANYAGLAIGVNF